MSFQTANRVGEASSRGTVPSSQEFYFIRLSSIQCMNVSLRWHNESGDLLVYRAALGRSRRYDKQLYSRIDFVVTPAFTRYI